MAISTVPGVERHKMLGKEKPSLRKRSIRHCETRSVGYLLSIDLMMLEKHLTRLLNWGCKSTVEGFFFSSCGSFFTFFFTSRLKKKAKKKKNIRYQTKMDCSGQGKQLICIKMSQERVPSTHPRHSVAQSDRGRSAGWTNRGHSDEYK